MRSKIEPILYYKNEGNNNFLIFLYMDDLIYSGNNPKLKDTFKNSMIKNFKMKYLGLMHYFIGMDVYQKYGKNSISQIKYVNNILKKFGMDNCTLVITLIADGELWSKNDGVARVYVAIYRSMVGSLMFLINVILDIYHFVSLISRYTSVSSYINLKITKIILKYLKEILDFDIHYYKNNDVKQVGYSDYEWGSNINYRKSSLGNYFSFGLGLII